MGAGAQPGCRPARARGRSGDVSAASEAARAAVTSAEPGAARARAPASAARGGGGREGLRGGASPGAARPLPAPLGLQPGDSYTAGRLRELDTPPGMPFPGPLHLLQSQPAPSGPHTLLFHF